MIAALIVIFLLLVVFEYCNLRTISEIKEQAENLDIQVCELAERAEKHDVDIKSLEIQVCETAKRTGKLEELDKQNISIRGQIASLSKQVDEISLELGSEEPKRLKNESYLEDGFANLMAYDPHRKTE